MNTYPEMNAKITKLLRFSNDPKCLYAAERIEELEAREGKLWEALQVLFECHSEGGFVEPNEDVLKQAGQALSRPRPAILDRLERLEKVYRNYLDMETPGRVDEEIPDDKESAYGKGYKDAVFDFTSDMEQALEGSGERNE